MKLIPALLCKEPGFHLGSFPPGFIGSGDFFQNPGKGVQLFGTAPFYKPVGKSQGEPAAEVLGNGTACQEVDKAFGRGFQSGKENFLQGGPDGILLLPGQVDGDRLIVDLRYFPIGTYLVFLYGQTAAAVTVEIAAVFPGKAPDPFGRIKPAPPALPVLQPVQRIFPEDLFVVAAAGRSHRPASRSNTDQNR